MKLQKYYDLVYDWLLINGARFLVAVIILLIGLKLIRFLRSKLSNRLARRHVHSSLQPFFLSLTITAFYILLIIVVMKILGWPLTEFTTIIGAFSVAAGLALSGTFQNFAGGVLILLLKPFELDDSIVAQGQEGKVTSIQIFYTVLLTVDNKTIIIPNGKLFNEVIVNVSRENRRRLDFEFKMGYAADIDKAKAIVLDIIKAEKSILVDFPVRVGVIAMDVDSIRFTVNVWVLPDDFLSVKISLMENILKKMAAAGIAFPKPG
ncbi:mechanosensitive ion channel family protein [Mucilaginibacter gotjawali]|uniref:Small conductance mechanosensitive channel n=2 Tax=Mucilaginibacter gotjawali TaxID=1550579 RepID=A0A839SAS1_9SPHI|nr:mechanosensitive ion channel domain-containing protein [Mucilaginibacter gotjawali]MBB3055261.1 small conductance mechanosensitive channel [Mucilaginibacter gotjawali]BAU56120.1 Small-conductance mechanosensitive channel [Mucilaginibacter gotjawali]